jgi:hypothetical protein
MTRLSTFVCTLLVAAVAGACTSSPTAPGGTSLTLAPGQSQSVSSLSVRFIGVTIDTRCPGDAICIQAGDAHIALEAAVASTRRAFELQLHNPLNRETEIRGFTIELVELAPYPFASMPHRPEDYRVTLKIHHR